jgi:hypothetical protein
VSERARLGIVFDRRYKLWWRIAAGLYVAAAVGLSIYWLVTGSGLARIFIELIGVNDGATVTFSATGVWALTMISLFVPGVVVRFALGRRVRVDDPDDVLSF